MPTQEQELARLQELEERARLAELEMKAYQAGGLTGAAIERSSAKALGALGEGAKKLGSTLETIDRYSPTGAPLRSGVAAAQRQENPVEAFTGQYTNPTKAPSWKEIGAKAGIPTTGVKLPIISNPVTNEFLEVSPAGAYGAVMSTVTDPTSYVNPPVARLGAGATAAAGAGVSEKVGAYLEKLANERAVKAATGQSVANIRKMAKISNKGAIDVNKMTRNLQETGRALRTADDAGSPVIGWGSNVGDIAEKSAEKLAYYGGKIGDVQRQIDQKIPSGAVDFQSASQKILDYAATIPPTQHGKAMQERLLSEAENLAAKPRVTFEEAQSWKNQFQFKPESSDALTSNQDVVNKMRAIIGEEMDLATDRAGLGSDYEAAKKQYGIFRGATDAASGRSAQDIANRFVSPSTYGTAGIGTMAGLAGGKTTAESTIQGLIMGAVNKIALERGNAFAARAMGGLANAAQKTPQLLDKYGEVFERAASRGSLSLLALHHTLMNNDPEYKAIIEEAEKQ